ncbi:MAG: DNA-processing protein DprA [Planctomycetota bacterium]|nr:DNA-processing protein DprA [Planctomycetota bacterium]
MNEDLRDLVHLTLTPGLGPVRIARLLESFRSASAVLGLPASRLASVKGIGAKDADTIARGFELARGLLNEELDCVAAAGVRLISRDDALYPRLLRFIPSAPPLLYARGVLDPRADAFPVAIVGSRRCTAYGTEQAGRFAAALAHAGLTVVSGGAAGIDAAAHRGAMRVHGRTVVVQGCGLASCYPPQHRDLFDEIARSGSGAIFSELPMRCPAQAENFPARNRIISGMSLGVLVIEAAHRSGSLITARDAIEQGREVFALPGRVDSPSSEGSLELLKKGEALIATDPGDVIHALEQAGRHLACGTFDARYGKAPPTEEAVPSGLLFDARNSEPRQTNPISETHAREATVPVPQPASLATPLDEQILAALEEPLPLDALQIRVGCSPAELRARLTLLELRRAVKREGSLVTRVAIKRG